MGEIIRAMISSTLLDLPEHRREVLEACLRQGVFPLMMEHLPASDADAIRVSLEIVDQADVYIGIFGFRYGHVPKGYDISIVEMEYDRACQQGIPRLIFVIDEEHLVKRRDIDCGPGEQKLRALLDRMDHVTARFRSPVELRAHVIDTLAKLRLAALEKLIKRGSE